MVRERRIRIRTKEWIYVKGRRTNKIRKTAPRWTEVYYTRITSLDLTFPKHSLPIQMTGWPPVEVGLPFQPTQYRHLRLATTNHYFVAWLNIGSAHVPQLLAPFNAKRCMAKGKKFGNLNCEPSMFDIQCFPYVLDKLIGLSRFLQLRFHSLKVQARWPNSKSAGAGYTTHVVSVRSPHTIILSFSSIS